VKLILGKHFLRSRVSRRDGIAFARAFALRSNRKKDCLRIISQILVFD
jgi:hypothetical protein